MSRISAHWACLLLCVGLLALSALIFQSVWVQTVFFRTSDHTWTGASPSISPSPSLSSSTVVPVPGVCSPGSGYTCVSVVNLCPSTHHTVSFSGSSGWRRVRMNADFSLIIYEVDYDVPSQLLRIFVLPEPFKPSTEHHTQEHLFMLEDMLFHGQLTCQLHYQQTNIKQSHEQSHEQSHQQSHQQSQPAPPRNPFQLSEEARSYTAFELPPRTQPDPPNFPLPNAIPIPQASTGAPVPVPVSSVVVPVIFDMARSRYLHCSLPIPVPLSTNYRLQLVYRTNDTLFAAGEPLQHTHDSWAAMRQSEKASVERAELPFDTTTTTTTTSSGSNSHPPHELRFGVGGSYLDGSRPHRYRFYDFQIDLQLCETFKPTHQFGMCYIRGYRDPERRPGHETSSEDVTDWMQYHRVLGVSQIFMYDRYGDFRDTFKHLITPQSQQHTHTYTQAAAAAAAASAFDSSSSSSFSSSTSTSTSSPSVWSPAITYYPFPPPLHASDPKYYAQMVGIRLCALHSYHTVRWLLQMDVDEFLVIHPNHVRELKTYIYQPQLHEPTHPYYNHTKQRHTKSPPIPTPPQPYPLALIDRGAEVPLVPICSHSYSIDNSDSSASVWVSSLSGCESALSSLFHRWYPYGIINLARYPVGDGELYVRPPVSDPSRHISCIYRFPLRTGDCEPDSECINGKYIFEPRGLLVGGVHSGRHMLEQVSAKHVSARVHHYEYQVQDRHPFGPIQMNQKEPHKFKNVVNDTSAMRIMYLAHTHVDRHNFNIRTITL